MQLTAVCVLMYSRLCFLYVTGLITTLLQIR